MIGWLMLILLLGVSAVARVLLKITLSQCTQDIDGAAGVHEGEDVVIDLGDNEKCPLSYTA